MTKDLQWAGFSRTCKNSTFNKKQYYLASRYKNENTPTTNFLPNTHKNYRDFRLKITHPQSSSKHYFLPNRIKGQQLRHNFKTPQINRQLNKSYKQKNNKLFLNVSIHSVFFTYLFFVVQISEAVSTTTGLSTTTTTSVSTTTGCICPTQTNTLGNTETNTMGNRPVKQTQNSIVDKTTTITTTTTNNCICPNIESEEEKPKTSTPTELPSLSEVESSTQLPTLQKRRKRRQEDGLDLSVDDFDQILMKKMPFAKYV